MRMKQINPGPLDGQSLDRIYQTILDESIRTQVIHGSGKEHLAKSAAPAVRRNSGKPVRG